MELSHLQPFLQLWHQTEGGRVTLINLSENHTFRIDSPANERSILRVHRPGYHTKAAIQSELAWLAALSDRLPVPRPLPGRNGEMVQELDTGRYAVLFAFEPGQEPVPGDELASLFRTLGRFAAIAHHHVESWQRPAGFVRPIWTAASILDAGGLWGDWRTSPHVVGSVRDILERLDRRLRIELDAYGTTPDRFNLIHADMRLANLLVEEDRLTLIDFDDCGFGWFMYDLAASLSFIETLEQATDLRRNWIEGYSEIRALSAADLEIIDAMILLRRMALLAWIGSHGETALAAQFRDNFARDTADMALVWLG